MDLYLIQALQGEALGALARSAAGALVAGVWQGMLLCAVAALLLRLAPRSTATLRFVVWAAVFAVSAAMPFVNLPGSALVERSDGATASPVMLGMRWSYVLAGLWLMAAAYRLVQLALQGFALRALWMGAAPASAEVLTRTEVPLLSDGRKVELCTSDQVDRPSVIGFFAPKILIPSWLLEQLSAKELNHIILHELEHLRRRDDWVNLLQKIGLVLLPLNPALFWIDRRLSTERELACDDGVLETTKTPRAYAESLASIAERRLDVRQHGRFGALALAATGLRRRRSELGERIESILGRRTSMTRAVAGGLAAAVVTAVVGAGAALSRAPKLVAFRPEAAAQEAAVQTVAAPPAENATKAAITGSVATVPKFENVGFHELPRVRVHNAKAVVRKAVGAAKLREVSQDLVVTPKQQRFVVLTSWEDPPVSRVVVQTPDGRFFLAPYAAVPTQAGWLFVQL